MRFWKTRKVPGSPYVGIVVAAYCPTDWDCARLQTLLASIKAQTYQRWRAAVVHDGGGSASSLAHGAFASIASTDDRFTYHVTPDRLNKFGHPSRVFGFNRLAPFCTHLMSTNYDNLYAPVFLEALLSKGADIAACHAIHSHKQWKLLPVAYKRGSIDIGSWIAKSHMVSSTPWRDFSFAGDWTFLSDMLKKHPSATKAKVDAALFMHN